MQLKELIWTWRYRECYAVEWWDLCVKKIKPITINIRSLVCNLLRDINQEEINAYNNIPEELKSYFPVRFYKKWDILVSERPKDYDGSFSKTLQECSHISNENFWSDIDKISDMMLEKKLYFFDIFHHWNNILVQRISKDNFKPIIIDCKRCWWLSYPLQLNLILDSEKEKKFKRRLERFKKNFKK